MLTSLHIRNFKRFDDVNIDLGSTVVFIGPNNSGKTTALQALALWDVGLRRWNEKRHGKATPEKRPGVTINRRDLIAVPVPNANLLWRDLHVRDVTSANGRQETRNIRVDIIVDGVTNDLVWSCGLEFDYANDESFYCRPLRLDEGKNPSRMAIPDAAASVRIAFLPPMSGLAANETRLDPGAINVRLGEGRTAEVLRNQCYKILTGEEGEKRWKVLCGRIHQLFGVQLEQPQYIGERGEIEMSYRTDAGIRLDLSSAGRGLQQTLLLLAHLEVNPRSVLLLDEPDAHLEILRQRHIYELLSTTALEHGSQIVAASHSEVILNEAADRDVVVAFLGKPHRIDDRGGQLLKSLKEIGFEQYYLAEQRGWVLYLEGSTDLAILRAFAERLEHPVQSALERPFVHYMGDQPQRARHHFRGLREGKRDLVGYVLCDRLNTELMPTDELDEYMWQQREIENYLCQPATLLAFAKADSPEEFGPLFASSESNRRVKAMDDSINDLVAPAALRDPNDSWWANMKASEEFLDRVFESYLGKLGLPKSLMRKSDYQVLARLVPDELIDPEITRVLDKIHAVSQKAKPVQEET
ncbi:MAG: AAA family ATPase [Pirellulales bacterium]